MNTTTLAGLLQPVVDAIPSGAGESALLRAYIASGPGGPDAPEGFSLVVEASRPLLAYITEDPQISALSHRMLLYPGGGTRLDAMTLQYRLVRLARVLGADSVARNLATLINADELTAVLNVAVKGVSVASAVDLGVGVTVSPWETVLKIDSNLILHDPALSPFDTPTAVFRKSLQIPKTWASGEGDIGQQNFTADYRKLLTAVLCTGVGIPAPIYVVGQWVSFLPQIPVGTGYLWGGTAETSPPIVELSSDEQGEVRSLNEGWPQLSSSWQDVLEISMTRLNSAMLKRSMVDRAIDLGIASEALFIQEGDGTSEITFKMSSRAAFLLATQADARLATAKHFRTLYGVRSTAAHSGRFPKKKSKKGSRTIESQVPTILAEGFRSVARAIRAVIHRRGVDWDQVMFGAANAGVDNAVGMDSDAADEDYQADTQTSAE